MELSTSEHEAILNIEKETSIAIEDAFFGDYYGQEVYKLWTNSIETTKKFHNALLEKGFNPNKTLLDNCLIRFF